VKMRDYATPTPVRRILAKRQVLAQLLLTYSTFFCSLCAADEWGLAKTDPVRTIDFVTDVQPIFARNCGRCHGLERQRSGYRLDVRDTAMTQGELYAPNIIPGNSEESPLIQFVSEGGDLEMPPKGPKLTDEEIETLKAWVDQGARWPDAVAGAVENKSEWWAWKPLHKPNIPSLEQQPIAPRVANPIDNFIVAELQRQGLRQAPPADRRTLIRRLYFDLLGLPPTPTEVEEFAADTEPAAYERLVDRLLASPRYGERWARHWMDAVHFAETHGHDQDRIREHAWPYRDYLIAAFNDDKPYSRFIQEQIAGDSLYPEDPQATIALGFLAAGPWDESSLRDILEDTIDRQIARCLDRDDMLSTVMNNVVSLTVQCARCHDHKFDAIPQRDYYALQAVFAGVERANRTVDASAEVGKKRKELLALKHALENAPATLTALLTSPASQHEVAAWEQGLPNKRIRWTTLAPESFTSDQGSTLSKLPDGSLLSAGNRPDVDTYTVVSELPLDQVTALRVETLADDSLPHRGPGRQGNGNLHLSELEIYSGEGAKTRAPIARAVADFNQTDWDIARAIDGVPQTAWGIYPEIGQSHEAVFQFRTRLEAAASRRLTVVLRQVHGGGHLIGRLRLSVTDAEPPVDVSVLPTTVLAALDVPASERSDEQRQILARHYFLEKVMRELAALPPPTLVYSAASQFEPDGGLKPPPGPRPIHLLHRGEISQPRELVPPGALSCVAEIPARLDVPDGSDESVRRAALAAWLTDVRNPLTWRSIVNRVWHHHFGAGIVPTLNDFGHMGSTASHPELLDWLAAEFRDGNHRLKNLHRLIVTSETYRQSSRLAEVDAAIAARGASIDADNRLLWRMNRTRLDSECVHDAILSATGRLDLRMGGPSDRQFALSPGIHVTPNVDYNVFDIDSDTARRRSVYRFLFRTLPDPFHDALDCPSGDQMTPARANSVTVQQALALWNNAFVLRQAEHLAARIESQAGTTDQQIDLAVQLVLSRPSTEIERSKFGAYAAKYGLSNACRLLFNSNEFMFVD
jgi:Protein of unknown function (DUF1549)/Protein of unknown function (DUF1553)/Planctomycete cytochrome C